MRGCVCAGGRVGVLWGKGGGVNMIIVQCTPVSLKLFQLSHLTDIVQQKCYLLLLLFIPTVETV